MPAASNPEAIVHLQALVRLRVFAVAAQAAILLAVAWWAPSEGALPLAAAVVAANAVFNAALFVLARRLRAFPPTGLVAVLLGDVAILTLLLALTGGPFNPFTFLYLVEVALATVVTGARGAWLVAGAAAAAYGLLFAATDLTHHDHARMVLHLRGMWVAFVVSAALVCVFVGRIQGVIGALRARDARSARLAALATLAGGAAHELATPLATISVAAEELMRKASTDVAQDAALVLEQVARCRAILERLAADGGHLSGEAPVLTSIAALVDAALVDVAGADRVAVERSADATVTVPPRAVASALRGLVRNALLAQARTVRIVVAPHIIEVIDDGVGMPAQVLARLGEPFFTTRATGEGMGLGVFVARALAEQLGGTLDFSSAPANGTRVVWTFGERA